jgi:hypothetical protein
MMMTAALVMCGWVGQTGWLSAQSDPETVPGEPSCWAEIDAAGGCYAWRVRAEAVALDRSRPHSRVLVEDIAAVPATLNASTFDFGFKPGWDVSLSRCLTPGWEIEARCLWDDAWEARAGAAVTAPYQVNTSPPLFPPLIPAAAGAVAARYTSRLHDFELNARHECLPRVTLLAGFRYVELDEGLHFDLPVDVMFDTATQNRLYGFQIGADAWLVQYRRLSVSGLAKLGLFGNAAAQNSILDDGLVTVPTAASGGTAAVLVEAGANADYRFTSRLSLRGGYSLIWIDGGALAADQIPVTSFSSDSGIANHNQVLYHGASLGLEYRW